MKRPTAVALLALAALAIGSLTLYTYRELPARLFAGDDYQWLLNVRGRGFGQVLRRAFDAGAQSHFYRPLVWLLFWAQARVFGLDPRGYHAVSLALHLLNAGLLGWLCYRLTDEGRRTNGGDRDVGPFAVRLLPAALAAAVVALHPAPFEAVVWVSAQSELAAAALLLVALHCWLYRRTTNDEWRPVADADSGQNRPVSVWSVVGSPWSILATLALALALLAKESAVIGLPLLVILGQSPRDARQSASSKNSPTSHLLPRAVYVLPGLVSLGYLALQIVVERRNYLLEQGGYGLGPQIVLNPLRSLALIVAPLAGSEHADAAWLVPVGALVALALLAVLVRGPWGARWLVLALGLTLLPTAPFVTPPNSRYLYLPVMAAAVLAGFLISDFGFWIRKRQSKIQNPKSNLAWFAVVVIVLTLSLALWSSGELHEREWRFAAGAGPGGSLWQLADSVCQERRPDRLIVVEPPVGGQIVEAIVQLSCGSRVKPVIVGRDQVAGAIKGKSVVVSFPNGSATVEKQT